MTDLWIFAARTTAVGMGVVFVALFLLSVYMHFFKEFTARLEGKGGRPKGQTKPRQPAAAPRVEPAPPAEPAPADDEAARTAAAVAVALAARGVAGSPGAEVAAAIAAALALHRARPAPAQATVPLRSWGLAGRLEAMAGRAARQERIHR